MRLWVVMGVLVVLFVAACAQNQLSGPEQPPNIPPPPPTPDVRPDIPHSPQPINIIPIDNGTPAGPNLTPFLNATLFTRAAPGGLIVGDATHPFLIGEMIGNVLPVLTREQLSILASEQPSAGGQLLHAEPYVRFAFGNETTGQLEYVRDPDTNAVGSELFFAEGEPMFEYDYDLEDAAFPLLIGDDLDLFGHTYEVHTVTNTSLQLYGKDVAQFVYLANNSALEVNGTSIANTMVQVDPWHFTVQYLTPAVDEGGLRLAPGEDLRSKVPRPEMFLNPLFDITYDGLEQNPNDTVAFYSVANGVRVDFFNSLGEPETMQLVNTANGTLGWGGNHALHVSECASNEDFCIAINDEFVLTSQSGVSRVFSFGGVGSIGDVLSLHDVATNEEYVVKLVDTGNNLSGNEVYDGTLALDGSIYDARVSHNASGSNDSSRISIDMNADGVIDGATVTVVTHSLHELTFPSANQTNVSRLVEFVSPPLGVFDEEDLPVRVSLVNGQLLLGLQATNITLSQVNDSETYQGLSVRGVFITLNHSPDEGVTAPQLLLAYPPDYRAGIVRITG